jgi:asparagine synthase (glutamine-hydrolysing)
VCGICGELRFDGAPVCEAELVAMRDRLEHRGPDSFGAYVAPDGRAGLGFRRLRIIDLSPNAGQPMANEDGAVQVVFNGEIYNYRRLRDGLLERGHHFRSQSDTEVIVHLYEEKGADCVAELEGMFAIAIWDERAQRLTLARDRAGKKPLFVYRDDRLLAFASEIKAFFGRPDTPIALDPDAVPSYFIYGYAPQPATLYKRVSQIAPGTLMTIEAGGRTATHRYWQMRFPEASEVRPIAPSDAARGVRERLTAAVERRLESDVPLGAFLSGGVDSTIVVGLMSRMLSAPVKTFSIGFEGNPAFDETSYARLAAETFHTDHTEFRVSPSAIDLIDTLVWHYDGPFGDSSAVPTYLVSKLTREHVTVVLTGDGGDELFAGYLRFYAALLAERIPSVAGRVVDGVLGLVPAPSNERHWLARAQRFFRGMSGPLQERLTRWNAFFFDDVDRLLSPEFRAGRGPIDKLAHLKGEGGLLAGRSPLSQALHANFVSYLADDLLVKTDRCTMANSIEARSPFLDRELIEYAALLPDDLKLRGRRTKAVLRDAFPDLLPPVIDGRGKMGFGVPLDAWFRGELRDYMCDLLLSPDARHHEMLSAPFVERLVARHLSGEANLGQQLWSIICFEVWLRRLPEWTRAARAASDRPLASPLA